MFKKFLLLIPYFKRLEKYRAEEKEKMRLWSENYDARIKKELEWNKQFDANLSEEFRLRDIRESLLRNQKFLKLRISRQTF